MSYLAIIERLKKNQVRADVSRLEAGAPYEIDEKNERTTSAPGTRPPFPGSAKSVREYEISKFSEESPIAGLQPRALPDREAQSNRHRCLYDCVPGCRGVRLRCVAHAKHSESTTVFRMISGWHDTLEEMLRLGILTGEALTDAGRPQ